MRFFKEVENMLNEARVSVNEETFFNGSAHTFRDDRRCRLAGIYMIENNNDGKKYIGKARNILERVLQHINAVNIPDDQTRGIDNTISREGWTNFTYSVLDYLPGASDDLLFSKEVDRIIEYNANDEVLGYNKTQGNWKHTQEFIDREANAANIGKADDAKFVTWNILIKSLNAIGLSQRVFMDKKVLLFLKSDNSLYKRVDMMTDLYDSTVKIISSKEQLERCYGMKFDLIISNPPYKKIGAEITKNIIDNINFDEFINLLPINDYTRVPDLINYVEKASRLGYGAFKGQADVDPFVAKISKTPVNEYDKEEFAIGFQYENPLQKFYTINNARRDRYFKYMSYQKNLDKLRDIGFGKVFIMTERTAQDGVHKIAGKGASDIRWNVNKDFDNDLSWLPWDKTFSQYSFRSAIFNSEAEHDNFAKFWYKDGYNLMNKLIKGLHKQSGDVFIALPQVDWRIPWTEEEILKEYGYTKSEIKYILSDEFLKEVTRQ